MIKSDYDQIQEMMATYAYSIDTRNYPGLRECFTPDASTVYAGHSNHLKGQDAIIEHMKRVLDSLDVTQHMFTNFIIDIQGDSAKLTCDILAQHVRQGERYLSGGKYKVDARRSAGKWLIANVSAGSVWSEGNKTLLPKAG
jgi:SnoaL-like domain